jgi:hypothetical protein
VVWVANRNHNSTAPDDRVALASLDTLDRLCEKSDATEGNAVQLIANIMEGPYSRPVKERAKHVLVNLLKHAKQEQQS